MAYVGYDAIILIVRRDKTQDKIKIMEM